MASVAQRCDFRPGDCIDRKYHVIQVLGEGSFGKVFKVKENSGAIYAFKLLKLWEVLPNIREQLMARFDMEFETGRIDSHYLVHSIAHGIVEGNPYIVMEYCPYGDLIHLTKRERPDLVKIGRHVLYGLKDLHACGKVHRDLKPENVLIKEDGTAALTDFGISGDRNKRMTEMNILGKPKQIFGTYAYMPPEQVDPKKKDVTVLPTTDIFSYGVMMYQLITGELPFGKLYDENDLVVYLKNNREGNWNINLLRNNPDGSVFLPVIKGCLVPDFRQRLQTVDDVLALLPESEKSSYRPIPKSSVNLQHTVVNGVLLRIMQGEEYGKAYRLNDYLQHNRRIITMGRTDDSIHNILPVKEEQSCYISRKHCTLELDIQSGQWYIRDGQWDKSATGGWRRSLNGTYVNSKQVPVEGLVFSPGDIISIGDVKMRVEGY